VDHAFGQQPERLAGLHLVQGPGRHQQHPPFAAAKVGETVGLKAQALGIKDVAVVVKGVGSGRESAIRGFISKSIGITSIKDATPVPFNGPKPKKPRRV